MDPIARSLLVCVALLVLSLPLIRPQALETDPDIYEITSQILNLTQHSIELGSNVSTTAFNASVLFGCQAASLFLDKGLWGAIQALLKGDGETYPEMQQCVDGCLFFFANTLIKPVFNIAFKILIPLPLPKPRIQTTFKKCYRKATLFKKDNCHLINNIKRCLLSQTRFPWKFLFNNFDKFVEGARRALHVNYGIFPVFPVANKTL